MTALSSLSLLLGVALLLLALRLEEDWRARYPILGSLSALAVTRGASACLVAFGGIGVTIALALPDSDQWAARAAMLAGVSAAIARAAMLAGVSAAIAAISLTSRSAALAPVMGDAAMTSDAAEPSDQIPEDEDVVGLTGTFVAPASRRAAGRVLIRRGDRTLELAAKPAGGLTVPGAWQAVVIVEVFQGTALVAPVDREGT